MKKTISILLIVAMMLTSMLAIIPASAAPKGSKITTAAEFAAMKADGEYYLANDIVISASYAEDFEGVLNGNGKTITVFGATPVFEKIVDGKVTDLTVNTSFEAEKPDGDFGALARIASGTFARINANVSFKFTAAATANSIGGVFGKINGEASISNVVATGSITQTTENISSVAGDATKGMGGIVGSANTDVLEVSIKNSTSYVDLTSNFMRAGVGGIIGSSAENTNLIVDSCQNYGNISANGKESGGVLQVQGVGGILGTMYAISKPKASVEITNSRNYGSLGYHAVTANTSSAPGGIIGYVYNGQKVLIRACVNSGAITPVNTRAAGGILGMVSDYNRKWASNKEGDIKIRNCINLANIASSGDTYVGGIVGYLFNVTSPYVTLNVEKCANYGNVSSQRYNAGILGLAGSGGGGTAITIKQCYNAGNANSGAIDYLKLTWASTDGDQTLMGYDKEANAFLAPYTAPKIIDFVNEGNVARYDVLNVHELGVYSDEQLENTKIEITNCVGIKGSLYAPTASTNNLSITETAPTDATATVAEVKAAVPANPSELDALLVPYIGVLEEDYTADSWAAFNEVYRNALAAANKANTADAIAEAAAAMQSVSLTAKVADTTALAAAIEAAEAKIAAGSDGYVVFSWNSFVLAYNEAKTVMDGAASAKPSVVNRAANLLTAAQTSLEPLPDKEELNAAIAKYDAYDQNSYTSAGWSDFADALAALKALADDESATTAKVNAALDAIANASALLVFKADTTALKAKADAALSTNSASVYTAKTYNDLNSLIKQIYEEIEANDMSAQRVSEFSEALDAAVARLVKRGNLKNIDALLEPFGKIVIDGASPRVDNDIVEALESKYTAESMKVFVDVLNKIADAKKQDNPPHFSEADAEKLEKQLQSAIDGLVPFASYAELDAKIAEVLELDKSKYTAESWAVLMDATKAAIALKSNRDAIKAQSDKALADINAAIEGLVEATVTDSAEEGGCKSAIGATVVVMTATLALGATTLLKKKDD